MKVPADGILRVEYEEPPELSFKMGEESPDLSVEYTTATAEVPASYAKKVNNDVYDAIGKAKEEYGQAETVVLGRHEYMVLDVLYRCSEGNHGGVGPALQPYRVVTVPGRMIHVPKPSERVVWDELEGER